MQIAKKIQILLLVFLAAQFCFPAALDLCLHLKPGSATANRALGLPLGGVTVDAVAKPMLTRKDWLSGDYPTAMNTWFGQNFPSRNLMVRLNNELNYDLFQKASGSLVIGKNNELFEKIYLDYACDIAPPMPVERMHGLVQEMAQLQSRLAKRGVPFVILLTPGKADIDPENIPAQYQRHKTSTPKNYDNLVPLLKEYGVNYVDGESQMQAIRETNKTPIFCQGGTHWTSYGAYRTARELEDLLNTRGLDLPLMQSDGVVWGHYGETSIGMDSQDYDLAELLNTYRPAVNYAVPLPIVHTKHAAPPTKKLVLVGGSFCWKPIWLFDREKVFKQIRLYYYYHTGLYVFPDHPESRPVDTAHIDWARDIFGADAVVLEINVAGMDQGVAGHYPAFLHDSLEHIDADGNFH